MSAVALPSGLKYGKVVGRFVIATGDTLIDTDHLPDGSAAGGTVTFTPAPEYLNIASATPPVTVVPKAVVCTVNASGYVIDPTGDVGVNLIATDDPSTSPTGWTYRVTLQIPGMKARMFDMAVPANTTTDLTLVSPVASAAGTPVTVGPPGPKGDPGPEGTLIDNGDGTYTVAGSYGTLEPTSTLTDNSDGTATISATTLGVGGGGGGGGAVESVNGHIGIVVLNMDDLAETATAKKLTAAERTKLSNVATGATANSADAQLRDRSTHTGTQLSSTVSDFAEAVEDAVAAILARSTNTGITWTYNDAAGTLQATVTGTAGVDAEAARDAVNAQFVGTGGVSITVNDSTDTVTFSISGVTISQVTGLQSALDGKAAAGFAGLLPGSTITVQKDPTTGFWPASYTASGAPVYTGGSASAGVRPTSRADVTVHWKGPDPSPPIVTSGAAGMLDGKDVRLVTP